LIVVKPRAPVKGKDIKGIEMLLKTFKRKVKDSRLMVDLAERQYFTKKSARKRNKKAVAVYRNNIEVNKQKEFDR